MHEMKWLYSHIGTIEDAVELIKNFTWEISISESRGKWRVYDGESSIYETDNRESLEAFLYGMALSFANIPDPYHDQLRIDMKNWLDDIINGGTG